MTFEEIKITLREKIQDAEEKFAEDSLSELSEKTVSFFLGKRMAYSEVFDMLETINKNAFLPVPKFKKGQTVYWIDYDYRKMSEQVNGDKPYLVKKWKVVQDRVIKVHANKKYVTYTLAFHPTRISERYLYATEPEAQFIKNQREKEG